MRELTLKEKNDLRLFLWARRQTGVTIEHGVTREGTRMLSAKSGEQVIVTLPAEIVMDAEEEK
jgi:hypothetical protein